MNKKTSDAKQKPKTTNKESNNPAKNPPPLSKTQKPADNNPKPPAKKELNPVKPRGKNPEKKATTRQSIENNQFSKSSKLTGKNKKEKKEPEKEFYYKLGKHILNNKEEEQDLDDSTFLKYNVIGLLFTGTWVPPAKEFLVKLEELYAELNKEEKIFEIVQISNEKSENDYKSGLTEKRPWLYLPFNDPFMKNLVEQFNVEYLPCFIIVNRELYVLSENGRKDMIDNEGTKVYEIWYKAYRERKEEMENEKEEKEDKDEQLNRGEN